MAGLLTGCPDIPDIPDIPDESQLSPEANGHVTPRTIKVKPTMKIGSE